MDHNKLENLFSYLFTTGELDSLDDWIKKYNDVFPGDMVDDIFFTFDDNTKIEIIKVAINNHIRIDEVLQKYGKRR